MTGDEVRDIFLAMHQHEDNHVVAPSAESIRNAMSFVDVVLTRDPKRNMRIRKLNSGGVGIDMRSEERFVHIEFCNNYATTATMIGDGKIKTTDVEDDRDSYESLLSKAQRFLDTQQTLLGAEPPSLKE